MRRVAVLLVMGLSACAQTAPVASNGSPTSASQTAPASLASSAPATECRLPVWWQDSSTTDIHAGLLAIPGGGITEAQTLSPTTDSSALSSFQFFGGTYLGAAGGWKRLNRALVSPDGTRYAYWNGSGTDTDSVHVLDLSTGADRVIYQGTVLYWPIASTR